MDLVNYIYGTLSSPSQTFRQIIESESALKGALLIVLIAVFCSSAGNLLGQEVFSDFFEEFSFGSYSSVDEISLSPQVYLIMGVVGGFLGWIFLTVIYHVIAKLLGGKGTFTQLLALMGFSHTPNVFQAPVGLFSVLAGGLTGVLIYIVFGGILSIWALILEVLAVKEAHKFSTGRAVLVIFIPVLLLIGIAFLLTLFIFFMS